MTKTFKDNPALQFISAAEEAAAPEDHSQGTNDNDPGTMKVTTIPTGGNAPEEYKYKLDPRYIETKTKRLQLVLQPSVFYRVKVAAAKSGLSVNEFCHQILDKATREE